MPFDLGVNQVEMMLLDPGVKDWPGSVEYGKAADTRRLYQAVNELGVKRIRIEAVWMYVEPTRAGYVWTDLDRSLRLAAEFGLEVLLIMGVHPPGGGWSGWNPSPTDFGNMCRAVAQRYGPQGFNIVSGYEVWNEMNQFQFAGPITVSPANYVVWLKAAADNIWSVHPTADIVTGGLMPIGTHPFGQQWSMDPLPFTKGIYEGGGKGLFTAIGNHPYTLTYGFEHEEPTPGQLFISIDQQIHDYMVTQGDGALKIWWTEFGWPSPMVIPEAQRADWFEKQIAIWQAEPHVGPAFIYNMRDSAADTSNSNNAFGLLDWAWNKKQPTCNYIASLNAGVNAAARVNASMGLVARQSFSRPAAMGAAARMSLTVSPQRSINLPMAAAAHMGAEIFGRPPASMGATAGMDLSVAPQFSVPCDFRAAPAMSAEVSNVRTVTPAMAVTASMAMTVGKQALHSYDFTGTGSTKPTSLFTDFALFNAWGPIGTYTPVTLPYVVSSSIARNGSPSVSGYYYSGGIYKTDQLSPDHFSEVVLAPGSSSLPSGDRSVVAIVRSDADGDNWVGCTGHWGGTNSLRIITCINGEIALMASNTTQLNQDGDVMRLAVDGNTYTVYKNGVWVMEWIDSTGLFPGSSNLRTGFGFEHLYSAGVPYNANGISGLWKGHDLRVTLSPVHIDLPMATTAAMAVSSSQQFTRTAAMSATAAMNAPVSMTAFRTLAMAATAAMEVPASANHPRDLGMAAAASMGMAVNDSVELNLDMAASAAMAAVTVQAYLRTLAMAASAAMDVARGAEGHSVALAQAASASMGVTRNRVAASYTFTGSTHGPLTDWGDGYSVSGGVAIENPHAAGGVWRSGGIWPDPCITTTHYAQTTINAAGYGGTRGQGVIVATDASATNGVAAFGHGFGDGNPTEIFTKVGSTWTSRTTGATTWTTNDVLKVVVTESSGVYTYTVHKNGVSTGISWTDSGAVITPGLYTGIAFVGLQSGGWFGTSGVKAFAMGDN